jgi:ATP-binding cassette subfamily B protein
VKEIKIYNLGPFLREKYLSYASKRIRERQRLFVKQNLTGIMTSFVSYATYFSIYCYAIQQIATNQITFGSFIFFTGAFSSFQSTFASIIANVANTHERKLFLNNLFSFLDIQPRIEPLTYAQTPKIQYGINFEDVSFRYPGSDKYVFEGLSLNISPGEKVAIVGYNGAGKSTFIKLLLRLYEPTKGSITIDKIDIRNFSVPEFHSLFNVLFQDFYKYAFSATENIGFGCVENISDSESILKLAKDVGVHQVISSLPNGYDTILGKELGDNSDLSMGEWQKIAIARALFRNSQIIVLDEPSSSLDPVAEDEVFTKFFELAKNKISIIVSHRLSTVSRADKIVFLKSGKILGMGTHKELMRENKVYSDYYDMQASKYFSKRRSGTFVR